MKPQYKKKPGSFKIMPDAVLTAQKGEIRYVVVSSTGKLICNCFGNGFRTKQNAYYGFMFIKKRYLKWKKEQNERSKI